MIRRICSAPLTRTPDSASCPCAALPIPFAPGPSLTGIRRSCRPLVLPARRRKARVRLLCAVHRRLRLTAFALPPAADPPGQPEELPAPNVGHPCLPFGLQHCGACKCSGPGRCLAALPLARGMPRCSEVGRPVDKPQIIETHVMALRPRPRIHCVAAPHVERSANPRDTSHPLENENDSQSPRTGVDQGFRGTLPPCSRWSPMSPVILAEPLNVGLAARDLALLLDSQRWPGVAKVLLADSDLHPAATSNRIHSKCVSTPHPAGTGSAEIPRSHRKPGAGGT